MASDLERLDALIAAQELAVRRAFQRFVATVGGEGPVLAAVVERLEARDTEGALYIVDTHVVQLASVLPAVAHSVGTATAAELAELVPDLPMAISFDPSHPRAAEIIQANRLRFVTDFTAQQRRAVLQALGRAYREGSGTQETARAFREAIGLTPQQEAAVQSYRQLLETQNRAALDRTLRDSRFDRTVARSVETGRPLTAKQVDNMVGRYRKRFVAMRAETIARTEGVRATSEAREEALDQMLEQTGISVDRVTRIWNPTRDTRTRDWHASMAGQTRGRAQSFTDGLGNSLRYPGDPRAPAATTINCRCGLTFGVRPAA